MMAIKRASRARTSAALAIACLLSVHPAPAKTYHRTMTYDLAGSGIARTTLPDRTCDARGRNCRFSSDGEINVGGMVFPPVGGRGRAVNVILTAKDVINPFGRVKIEACEDFDQDGACSPQTSTGGDRRIVYACLASNQSVTLYKISRALPVIVYVYTVWGCPRYLDSTVSGSGGGTMGSITETWTS